MEPGSRGSTLSSKRGKGEGGLWIGRRLRRREDPPLLTGQGHFSADRSPLDLVHLAIRRAGVVRAEALTVDLAPALAMPGVLGAWKAGELGLADDFMPDAGPNPPARRRPLLAFDTVHYEGDAVAAIVAETEYQAHDAAAAVGVDFRALGPDREETGRQTLGYGDLEEAFARAPVHVTEHLSMARICGGAMEPRSVLAEWDESEQCLLVRASVGSVYMLRDTLAACLGLDPGQIVALAEDVGGSFGAKNSPYPEYVIAAAASRRLGRPVRWSATRSEDGQTTGQAHAVELDLEVAAEPDGRLLGLLGRVEWPIGAYVTRGVFQERNMATHAVSAYRLPSLRVQFVQRHSNSPPAAHIRGGGRPVGNFAIERMLDRLARCQGLDPVEVRRRNLIQPSEMPYATGFEGVVYDGGDYPRLLDLAAERIDVAGIRARQKAGEPVGLGVAMCVESTGIGSPESSRVAVQADGMVFVYAGTAPQGQGHRTFAAQVAADRLGWPLERVEVRTGDSRNGPPSSVTAGSRSALEVGNSVALSAAAARRLLLERATEMLEVAPEDLVVGPQGAAVRGVPDRRLSLAELVGDGLEAVGTWDSEGKPAWASSCHAALVRVDAETGGVEILRYAIAHDSGRSINPLLVEGQLHGGYAHGLGYALFEEALFSEDGALISSSFLDYTVVSAPEMACEPELLHTETPSSHNPEGFRGVGEAGTIAVPAAIANAIEDALWAAGQETCVDAVPVTPQRLWRLLGSETR
jgi:carbon-monoxide dehydrogenase large subunit